MQNDPFVHAHSETGCHTPVITAVAPRLYYKCVAQIAETIIEFWKSKTRTINKNNNQFG